jgi:hypothetical protein
MPDAYSITGTVTSPTLSDRAGITVQAFDRNLPSLERRVNSGPQALGEAVTDSEGRFQITYAVERLASGEGVSAYRRTRQPAADLWFRAVARGGREIRIRSVEALNRGFRPDQIIFNAPAALDVTIVVDAAVESGTSEYEELVATLAPVILDVSPAQLADDDVAFLVSELQIEEQRDVQQRIEWLRAAARMAADTSLPAEAFYAWARTTLPELWAEWRPGLDEAARTALQPKVLDALAATAPESLIAHLQRAVDERIVPGRIAERAAALADAMRRRSEQQHALRIRLVQESTGAALAGRRVNAIDVAKDRDLGTDLTGVDGELELTIGADAEAADVSLRLRVFGPDASEPVEVARRVPLSGDGPAVVRVPIDDAAPTLRDVASRLGVPDIAAQTLADRHQIRSFADIRRRGGLASIPDPGVDAALVAHLDALADLDRLSSDLNETATLLDRRYSSVLAVASASRREFVTAMGAGGTMTERRALELHIASTAQVDIMSQILAGRAVDAANGFDPPPDPPRVLPPQEEHHG